MFRRTTLKVMHSLNPTPTLINEAKMSLPKLLDAFRSYSSEPESDAKINNKIVLKLFNPKNPADKKALHDLIDAGIAFSDTNKDAIYETLVKWLETYVNNSNFLKLYDQRSLELMAEAVYWSDRVGLSDILTMMSYTEIRKFEPLREGLVGNTVRAHLLSKVINKLTKPAWSFEASFALQNAAVCVYVRNNSYEKYMQEESEFEAAQAITSSPRGLRKGS